MDVSGKGSDACSDELLTAARNGDEVKLRQLIDGGTSVNRVDSVTGWSALHYAVAKGHIRCAVILLSQPCMATWERPETQLPPILISDRVYCQLALAPINFHRRLALKRQGIAIDENFAARPSLIHLALKLVSGADRLRMVKLLVKRGEDIRDRSDSERGMSPLHVACENSSPHVIKVLLSKETLNLRTNPMPEFPRGKLAHAIAIENGNIDALIALFVFEEKTLANSKLTVEDGIELARQAAGLLSVEALSVVFQRFQQCILERGNGVEVLECALPNCDGDGTYMGSPGSHGWPRCYVEGRGKLARRKQQRCLDYLLQQGCKPYSHDATGRLSLRALGYGIEMQLEILLDALLQTLTPAVVATTNSAAASHHYESNPLLAVIATRNIHTLEKLLNVGFDAKYVFADSNDLFEDKTCKQRRCQNITSYFRSSAISARFRNCPHIMHGIGVQHHQSIVRALAGENGLLQRTRRFAYNYLSHAIVQVGLIDVLPQMVTVLLKHKIANAGQFCCDFSPLLVLCWVRDVSDSTHSSHQMIAQVFNMLAEAGVNCTSDRKNPNFNCSEMVLGAALSGSGVLLANVIAKTGINPLLLIQDLAVIKSGTLSGNRARLILRIVVGNAARTIIKFSAKASVRDACRRVDENFPAQETAGRVSTWSGLYDEFERVDTLQHLSRVAIVSQLAVDPSALEITNIVQRLELPTLLKQYLLFPDVVRSGSDYVPELPALPGAPPGH